MVVLLAAAFHGSAEDGAGRTAQTTRLALAPCLSTYRDAAGTLTLDQVRDAFRNKRFQPGRKPWPSFGFTTDAIWVRFAVRSETATRLPAPSPFASDSPRKAAAW